MDKISVVGVVLGVAAILLGQVLEGGHLSSLVQPTAFFIVIGGTLGAVMLQSPLPVFIEGVRMARWVLQPPTLGHQELIQQVIGWAQIARKEGLLALESRIAGLPDPFSQ